jgi:fructose-1,6-bisphosphatase/inositol monophosphatase family enzyme
LRRAFPIKGHGDFEEWGKIYAAIAPEVAGIRRFGAASLDLAWLAAGRYDGFWESGLSPWDTAAGCLIVREAGGFVTDYRGRSPPSPMRRCWPEMTSCTVACTSFWSARSNNTNNGGKKPCPPLAAVHNHP